MAPMASEKAISADFPFESKFLEVKGSKMHYIEEGTGNPILFLHGNPTSSYLWRNIIPYLSSVGRCIAVDLIGMGKSDKPNIDYRFVDHYEYLKEFIQKLDLKNITLVIHDWGSGLGFHYAMENEDNIKGIAFMEAIVQTAKWSEFPANYKIGFKLMRTPFIGWLLVNVMNIFLKQILPSAIIRKLSKTEMDYYLAPYPSIGNRKPLHRWPNEIPIDGYPTDTHEIISNYSEKLKSSTLPKLLLYAKPGGLIPKRTVAWCKDVFPNLETVDVGKGIHYLQEDNPHGIGEAIAEWYGRL